MDHKEVIDIMGADVRADILAALGFTTDLRQIANGTVLAVDSGDTAVSQTESVETQETAVPTNTHQPTKPIIINGNSTVKEVSVNGYHPLG